MRALFILGLAVLTSFGTYFFAIVWLRLPVGQLRAAFAKMLESVGTILVFVAINLGAAITVVLALRGLTKTFVSVYIVDDATLVALSVLQSLTLQWWRESRNVREAAK
jgi:hypothetical protein